jgi:hypothetical protein
MRLKEYTQFLKTNSPNIEFSTKNGKMIVCWKQADEMEEQLKQAEHLLQAMVESRDVLTIEAIHQLCDLAAVLDQLKLQEECIVVGDCAMKLAQALGLQALEFQKEQAQTIARIAQLDVYQSQACPLFIQAISVCEAFVIEDGLNSAKMALVEILHKASFLEGHDTLCVQWLGHAIDLITELPSAMVTDGFCGVVYSNYGVTLHDIGHLEDAARVKQQAVTLFQTLVDLGHNKHKEDLARALNNYGVVTKPPTPRFFPIFSSHFDTHLSSFVSSLKVTSLRDQAPSLNSQAHHHLSPCQSLYKTSLHTAV